MEQNIKNVTATEAKRLSKIGRMVPGKDANGRTSLQFAASYLIHWRPFGVLDRLAPEKDPCFAEQIGDLP